MDVNEFNGFDNIKKTVNGFNDGMTLNDRYELIKELGRGAFGVVWKATDRDSEIEVALKLLPREISHSPIEFEKVKKNYQLVHTLIHTNIAVYKDLVRYIPDNVNAEEFGYFLVMEYVEGITLGEYYIKNLTGENFNFSRIIEIGRQIADALDFAHKKSVVHRDIKPENIMINTEDDVKILDFGIAAQLKTSMNRVSKQGVDSSGTLPYMSPEQWRGRNETGKADQYSLATLIYELLSGEVPFNAADSTILRGCVLEEIPEEIEGMSKAVNEVLLKGLAKLPKERYDSCGDFIKALEDAGNGNKQEENFVHEAESEKSADREEKLNHENSSKQVEDLKSNKKLLVAALVIFLFLGGAGVWVFNNKSQKEKAREDFNRLYDNAVAEKRKGRFLLALDYCSKASEISGYSNNISLKDLYQQIKNLQNIKEKFDRLYRQAEENFNSGKYDQAEVNAGDALQISGYENNEKAKKLRIAAQTKIGLQQQFDGIVSKGDKAASEEKYSEALAAYNEASHVDGYLNNQLIKIKIANAEKMLAELQESEFNDYVNKGKDAAAKKDYLSSIKYYNDALNVAGYENNEKAKKLRRAAQTKIELQQQFDRIVSKGDKAVSEKRYSDAIAVYNEVSKIEGYKDDELIKIKIANAEKMLAELQESEFNDYVNKGKDAAAKKDYLSSIKYYNDALGITGYENNILVKTLRENAEKKLQPIVLLKKKIEIIIAARKSQKYSLQDKLIEQTMHVSNAMDSQDFMNEVYLWNEKKKELESEYNKFISSGDEAVAAKRYEEGINHYLSAEKVPLFGESQDVKVHIANANFEKSLYEKYKFYMAEGHTKEQAGDYHGAEKTFGLALSVKGYENDQAAVEARESIRKIIEQYRKQLTDMLAELNAAFENKNYVLFNSLLAQTDKIYGADKNTELNFLKKDFIKAKFELQNKFNCLVGFGDNAMLDGDFALAVKEYSLAMKVPFFMNNFVVSDKLKNAEQKLQTQLEAEFNTFVENGRVKVADERYLDAKVEFEKALLVTGYENNQYVMRLLGDVNEKINNLQESLTAAISKIKEAEENGDYALMDRFIMQTEARYGENVNVEFAELKKHLISLKETFQSEYKSVYNTGIDELNNMKFAKALESFKKAAQVPVYGDNNEIKAKISEAEEKLVGEKYNSMMAAAEDSLKNRDFKKATSLAESVLKLRGYENDKNVLAFMEKIKKSEKEQETPNELLLQIREALKGSDSDLLLKRVKAAKDTVGYKSSKELVDEINNLDGNRISAWDEAKVENIFVAISLPEADPVEPGVASSRAQELTDLGNKYRNGDDGYPKDEAKAVSLYEEAAALGHGGAQGILGRIYYFGTMGVRKDYNRSFSLMNSSAMQGDRDSQFILGDMYANGIGTARDNRMAAQYYRDAASQGHREAQSKYRRYKKYL